MKPTATILSLILLLPVFATAQIHDVLNFETIKPWNGLTADAVAPHEGRQSGRWDNHLENNRIKNPVIAGDFSTFTGFTMWIWSGSPTGSSIAVCLLSENPGEERAAYYRDLVTIDWTGWRKIEVPFSRMTPHNDPAGFGKITGMLIASTDYETKNQSPAMALKFDELRFVKVFGTVQAESAILPAEVASEPVDSVVIFDFENVRPFSGLEQESSIVASGKGAGLWRNTTVNDRVTSKSMPSNMAGWDGISVRMHSEVATYADIAVVLRSDNNSTEGADYFQDRFVVDWTGWNDVYIPFRSMSIRRQPLGFANINEVIFASTGYGIDEADPRTVLRLDDLRLVRDGQSNTFGGGDIAVGKIRWGRSIRAAVSQAVQADHLVLIFAYSQEGVLARQVNDAVFRDQEVEAVLSNAFECYRFDAAVQTSLTSWFKITRVPVVMIYTADGDELARFEGDINRNDVLRKARELARR